MAGLGLILGAGLAGGMQGLGEGATKSLQMSQEAQQKQDLVRLQAQLEEDKDLRIAAINQDYHVTNAATDNQYQVARDNAAFAQQTKEGNAGRASNEKVAGMQTAAEIQAANIRVGGELGSARISAAQAKYAVDLAAQAPTIQSMADGSFQAVHRDLATGKMVSAPLLDKDGKPLIGQKNISADRVAVINAAMAAAGNLIHAGEYDTAGKLSQAALAVAAGADPSVLTMGSKTPIDKTVLATFGTNPAGAAAHFDDSIGKSNGLPPGTGMALAKIAQSKGGKLDPQDVWVAAGQVAGGNTAQAGAQTGQTVTPAAQAAQPAKPLTPPANQVDPNQQWSGSAWTNAYNSGALAPPPAQPSTTTSDPRQFAPQRSAIGAARATPFSVLNNDLTGGNANPGIINSVAKPTTNGNM